MRPRIEAHSKIDVFSFHERMRFAKEICGYVSCTLASKLTSPNLSLINGEETSLLNGEKHIIDNPWEA